MKYLAAFALASIQGAATKDAVVEILKSTGAAFDAKEFDSVWPTLEGKCATALIAEGATKMSTASASAAGSAAPAAGGAAAPAAAKKEESEEEDDGDMGMGLFD